MRDPKLYSESRRWTDEESILADEFVAFMKSLRETPDLTQDEIDDRFQKDQTSISQTLVAKVLEKMKEDNLPTNNVIVLTAADLTEDEREKIKSYKIKAFLEKPAELSTIMALVSC